MDVIKHSSTGKDQEDADSKLETQAKSIKGLSDKALKKYILKSSVDLEKLQKSITST